MSIYDVIIIGGRVAGSAAAIELSKRGHKILVLDQSPPTKDVISTHFVNPRGLSYLNELGVLDTLARDTPLFKHFDVTVDDIKAPEPPPVKFINSRTSTRTPPGQILRPSAGRTPKTRFCLSLRVYFPWTPTHRTCGDFRT
ncbi:MAG: FAD-dependent monooxygenase, partial [Pseudomonadota bacterium]